MCISNTTAGKVMSYGSGVPSLLGIGDAGSSSHPKRTFASADGRQSTARISNQRLQGILADPLKIEGLLATGKPVTPPKKSVLG